MLWLENQVPEPWATLVFAHGAGAPMDHPSMEGLSVAFQALGVRMLRFEFAYMARRRDEGVKAGPDRLPKLQARFREALAEAKVGGPLFLGGRSMGGRVATTLAGEPGVSGVVVAGYPFHPPGKPEKTRLEPLQEAPVPVIVLQGERDPFGKPAEVAAYDLPEGVSVVWIADGDHGLKPRKASGRTWEQNLQEAAKQAAAWMQAPSPQA